MIDQRVLDGLLEVIGAEALTDVLDSCRRQFEDSQMIVTAALARGDSAELLRLTHDLKSSALNIGLNDLGGLAREIETACREGHGSDALRLAQGLGERLLQACAAIRAIDALH